jgi:hypothetical protein
VTASKAVVIVKAVFISSSLVGGNNSS